MNSNEVISHVLGPRQFDRVCKAVDQVANTLAVRYTDWVVDLAVYRAIHWALSDATQHPYVRHPALSRYRTRIAP